MRCGFSGYLFDLDGTLLDTIELILSAYRHTLAVHRGKPEPDKLFLEKLGMPLQKQLEVFTEDPQEIAAMRSTYREYYHRHHDGRVRAYPGALEAVRALKARGGRLAIVTSKLRPGTLRGLEQCGFEGLFEVLVTAEDVERHKPEPAPVLRALELLEVAASQAVFTGDSPHDLAAGRAAGVATAAALWGPFPRSALAPHAPDFWLERASDIVRLGERVDYH